MHSTAHNYGNEDDAGTQAGLEALEAGLNLLEMPDAVKNDKALLEIYLNGLKREKANLISLIDEYQTNFKEAENSQFYAVHGLVMTEGECSHGVTSARKHSAVCEWLIDRAMAARNALDLATFNSDMKNSIVQLNATLAAGKSFKQSFLDGLTERTAQQSYQLLKEHFSASGKVDFSDMVKMLDECHKVMDEEEPQTTPTKDQMAYGVIDLASSKAGAALDDFYGSTGFTNIGEVASQPVSSRSMKN